MREGAGGEAGFAGDGQRRIEKGACYVGEFGIIAQLVFCLLHVGTIGEQLRRQAEASRLVSMVSFARLSRAMGLGLRPRRRQMAFSVWRMSWRISGSVTSAE